jgi:diguanylate cyclase (GGDEF)-like protein/PAS domain S-box-containing protein
MISLLFDPANYQFNPYAIPTFLAATAIVTLGGWVILREVRSQVSWLLFTVSMAVGIWLFSCSLMYSATNPATALWWAKLTYLGVAFIPVSVYHFTVAVLHIDQRHRTQIRASWALSVIFLLVILTTDAFMARIHHYWWGYYPLYGWFAIPFLGFFFTLMVASFRHYWSAYRTATRGTHKLRIKAFMFAFAVAYLGSWDYLAGYGVAAYPFGYLCILGFLAMTVRAVWRYRLVDIRSAFTAGQILETMQGAVLVVDLVGRIAAINPPACTMLGYRESELLGLPVATLVPSPPGNGSAPGPRESPKESDGAFRDREMAWRTRDGRRLDVVVSASDITDRDRFTVGTVYVAQDITERKQAEEALRLLVEVTATANESGEFYAMISRCLERICVLKRWQVGQAWFVNASHNALICPAEACYAEVDVTALRLACAGLQLSKGEGPPGRVWAGGTPVWIADITAEAAFPHAGQARAAGLKAACAFPIAVDDQLFAIFEFFSQEARSPDPHFLNAVQKLGVHLGIVFGRRRAQEALAEQAIRDTLTGLYNRRYFNDRIETELVRADRHHHSLAFLLCDLDHFKQVNDTRGHQTGDQILKAVAARILEATRGTDLVFRWGGDEIVVVLPEASRDRVFTAADRIRSVVRAVGDQEQAVVDLSIGVAIYPEHGTSVDQLIRFADRALYIAKKGGDKVHIGEEEYHLNADAVTVVFQPVVEIGAGRIIGYEALSRDPHGRLTIHELFGRYQAVGQLQELKRICFESQLRAAAESGLERVFINVDFDLLNQLGPLAPPPGIDVILEISEREALHDIDAHLNIAEQWRRHGFRLAIDDFGAGFISLPFIARLTPDYIKVDRSMTLHAVSSKQFKGFAKDLVRALRNYAAEGIIAEGIETEKELAVVKEMGIGLVQGFLLDRLSAGWEAKSPPLASCDASQTNGRKT